MKLKKNKQNLKLGEGRNHKNQRNNYRLKTRKESMKLRADSLKKLN